MTATGPTGLHLMFPGKAEPLTDLQSINVALLPVGARIWALDFSGDPLEIATLRLQQSLSEAEKATLMEHTMLPRERLLEVIAEAGRRPEVPGGGAMTTHIAPYDYTYPQLFLVEAGVDYSRFDRYHINTDDYGVGVDEFMFVLSGSGVVFYQHLAGGAQLTLTVDCPDEKSGWLITYEGKYHHIGSISGCAAGSKILMQVIGPERWTMRYEEDMGS